MATRTYSQLISLVRNWSNRDTDVLSNAIIADCLRYAADKAYRQLRIAPLEHTLVYNSTALQNATYSSNNRFSSVTELAIPADLIEFIQIRGIDSEGRTTRMFNEKADVRTFNDLYAEKYSDLAFWTRQGNCILLSPGFGNAGTNFGSTGVLPEEGVELYYYRRLPALYARFQVNASNANNGLNTTDVQATMAGVSRLSSAADNGEPEVIPVNTENQIYSMVSTVNGQSVTTYSDTMTSGFTAVPAGTLYGISVPNWLKDQNERVVLMGALAEAFFYLQENEEAAKYAQLFLQELDELNKEDQMRTASGGNVQINFNGRGLI